MFIKQITIESVDGLDVVITHTDAGAIVRHMNRANRNGTVICEVRRDEDRDARYAKAYEVARIICGECRDGGPRGSGKMVPNATNSMIHDVLNEIERVAGC